MQGYVYNSCSFLITQQDAEPQRATIYGDYILPAGVSEVRSRYDLCFANIGTAAIFGGALGLVKGFQEGVQATKGDPMLGFKARRTQVLNYTSKASASTSQKFGLFLFLYSAIGIASENVRKTKNDDKDTVAASTLAPALFFAKKGLKPATGMASIGFLGSAFYCYYLQHSKFSRFIPDFFK